MIKFCIDLIHSLGIRTQDPKLLYLIGFEDARLNDEHAIELIILKFDNSGLIKDLLDLSFPLLPQPEADIAHIGSSTSALQAHASCRQKSIPCGM